MKKIVAMVMVFVFTLCGTALADGVDIASMSDDQLIELRDSINYELANRNGFSDSILYPGIYVCGESIEPGGYVLTCDQFYISTLSMATVTLYLDAEHNDDRDIYSDQLATEIGQSIFVQLIDGMIMEVGTGSFTVTKTNSSAGSGVQRTVTATEVPEEKTKASEVVKGLKPIQAITSPTTEPKKVERSTVTPEFKTAMDSYEEFFNDYVDFMVKYENSDDIASMFEDLSSYMMKYAEMVESLNAIDETELSVADSAYYLEVTARILRKLEEIE